MSGGQIFLFVYQLDILEMMTQFVIPIILFL